MLKRLLGALALLVVCAVQAQSAPTPLDSYLDNLKTLRASFLQVLVDAHGKEIDRSTGTIVVVRPGKLRWDIHPQTSQDAGGSSKGGGDSDTGSQLLVVDGKNVWSFDRDLQQVIVKPVDAALSATPAMLLSGTVDVRKNFTISPAGKRDGLDWVLVEPRSAQADFRRALFGFERGAQAGGAQARGAHAAGELKKLILDDKLGQTATVTFQKIERNSPVPPDEVSFTPPPGVDVIGTPHK